MNALPYPKPKDAPPGLGKDPVVVRLKGNAMRKFRFDIWMRDRRRCVRCGQEVSFNGKRTDIPPMHLAHRRSKRLWGDVESNCETACPQCHLVEEHMGGKVVPRKD